MHIQIAVLPTKGKALPDKNCLRRQNVFHACDMVNCGKAALGTLAYSEAGQTLASMNEWEASEDYL